MIRKANSDDILRIAQTYEDLLLHEQAHTSHSNWQLGLYPTIKVPQEKVPTGTMFVLEEEGEICASMVLNDDQAEEYTQVEWQHPAKENEVLVIHTLCIPPQKAGRGYGRQMVDFAKQFAKENACIVIRIDTFAHNEPAKKLYLKNGFTHQRVWRYSAARAYT